MYDAIIVGARCGGSPTAMLLARKGHKVLVVDKMSFPSDIMSTHYIQPHGVKFLQDWGLLDTVIATNCPPLGKVTFFLNGMAIVPPREPGLPPAYCPRRTVLDKILVDAAGEAGAEVRENASVQELIFEGDRVVGIRARSKSGGTFEERAAVVVGADGMHSTVAREVKAPAYHETPSYTCAYYSYFSGVPMDGAEISMGENTGMLAFPTNDGEVCIAVGRENADFHEYRKDIEGNFMKYMEIASPSMLQRVREGGKREERFIGTADVPGFFRKPYGAGWALVGDAGYHKDPVTGLGIMDAFRDADYLADAIDAGLSGRQPMDEALAGYQQKRDEVAVPLYEFTSKLAQMPDASEMLQTFAGAAELRPSATTAQ